MAPAQPLFAVLALGSCGELGLGVPDFILVRARWGQLRQPLGDDLARELEHLLPQSRAPVLWDAGLEDRVPRADRPDLPDARQVHVVDQRNLHAAEQMGGSAQPAGPDRERRRGVGGVSQQLEPRLHGVCAARQVRHGLHELGRRGEHVHEVAVVGGRQVAVQREHLGVGALAVADGDLLAHCHRSHGPHQEPLLAVLSIRLREGPRGHGVLGVHRPLGRPDRRCHGPVVEQVGEWGQHPAEVVLAEGAGHNGVDGPRAPVQRRAGKGGHLLGGLEQVGPVGFELPHHAGEL
mmetsp:Transcript_97655/g.254504  ORF Transcript_97655/g.254504 Transcript_97655/m.254504 type:complete len:292 (+) Transcript_97655:218-1093(+)